MKIKRAQIRRTIIVDMEIRSTAKLREMSKDKWVKWSCMKRKRSSTINSESVSYLDYLEGWINGNED